MYVTIERKMENKIEISRLDDTNRVFMHYHNFLEIAYVISGEADHQIGEHSGKLHRGSYFIVDYNTPHHYISPKNNLTIINCLFLPEFIDPAFSDAKSFNELCERYYFRESGRLINGPASNIVFEDDGTVGRLFTEMHKEYSEQKEGFLIILRHLLSNIIIETIRKVGSNDKISSTTASIIHKINACFGENLTLAKICKEQGYSVPYISAKFRNETGFSFTEYLQNRRIEEASRLLATTDMSITEIAERCGYGNLKFFGKVFKSITKTTPREIRKQSRGR